jgi:uncharacterized protein YycO
MSTIKLLFCTNPRNPLSWAIRACTWSTWSHVAIVDGESIIEAVALQGVIESPLAERQQKDPRWRIAEIPCADPRAVIAAARGQIGKPYDYTAVLGLGLHRVWKDADSWFCSELVAWSFAEAGLPLFRAEALQRVTPQHLWMLPPAGSITNETTQPSGATA